MYSPYNDHQFKQHTNTLRANLVYASSTSLDVVSKTMERFKDWRSAALFSVNSILQVVLLVLFMIFFGVPSIEKYLDKQTIAISSKEQTNGIEAPAITFVAIKKHGWKSVDKDFDWSSFDMVRHCQKMNFTDVDICQKNDTFGRDDFLKSARLGFYQENSRSLFNESSMWTEDMTLTFNGRHFTLNPAMKISAALIFEVDNSFDYLIWIHDANFFIPNINSFGLPSKLWITGKELTDEDALYHMITLTKHKKLNLARQPCEEDPTYSFAACIKEKLSEIVGCRLPWDKWSKQDHTICTNEQEFGQCEQIYEDLFNAESEEIVEATGCLQPCTYNEYKFVSENPKRLAATDDPKPRDGSQTVLSFWVASSKTWIEEEVLLYPFTSFLAEFGGALGLFLGFSFMAIWQEIRGFCWK